VKTTDTAIEANYRSVRERIAVACRRAGRAPDSVTLLAVIKYAQVEWARRLVELGVSDLGENRPQQLVERAGQIAAPVQWHLIGHLQRNKVRSILPLVRLIHSADSLRLLEAIDRIAHELGLSPGVLLEINLTGDEAKHGFRVPQLLAEWDIILKLERVRVEGLMTMAAYNPDPESARPTFARLREIRNGLQDRSRGTVDVNLKHLSMGMTGDFEVAIEEGATLVRIGSALWEGVESVTATGADGGHPSFPPLSKGG
jgi:pyridoxal phosphate enzyme (YggS family)